MTMREKENPKAVDFMLDEVRRICERLNPSDDNPNPHRYQTIQEQMQDSAKLLTIGMQMGIPIVKAFYNGGFPSKRAGKKVDFFGMKIPTEQLATVLTRIAMIGGLVWIIVLLRGGTITVNGDGMKIQTTQQQVAR